MKDINKLEILNTFLKLDEKLIKEIKEDQKIKDVNELMKCLLLLQNILKLKLKNYYSKKRSLGYVS